MTARDPYGEYVSQPMTVTVRTNAAPEAAEPIPPQTVLIDTTSEPLDLTPYFHDPDGDPLTYMAVSDNAGVAIAEVAEGSSQLTIRAVEAGEAIVIVTASDPFREHASQSMTVTVRTNAAPEAAQPLEPRTVLAGTTTEPLELTPYFHDPDGDPLTFAAVSDNAGVRHRRGGGGRQPADHPHRGGRRGRRRRDGPRPLGRRDHPAHDGDGADERRARGGAAASAADGAVGTTSEPLELTPYFHDPDDDPLTYTAVSDNAGVAIAEVAEGGSQLTIRAVAVGEAVVVVTARDPFGEHASQFMTVKVRTNAAPEAAQPLEPRTVLAGTTTEPLELTPYFHDPDGDPLTFAAVSDNAGVAIAEVAEGGSQLTIRAVEAGEAVVVVTASDPWGAEASQPMTLTVRTNAAPEVAQPLPTRTLLAETTSEPLELTPYFHDPDGDPLAFAAVSYDPGVAIAEVAEGGSQLTIRAMEAGEAVVVVTASDPFREHASQSMTLTVRTNAAPEAAQPLPTPTVLAGTTTEPLELTPYFHDPDGDPLTFAAVSDNAGVLVAEVAEGGSPLTIRAVEAGEAVVVVTASDPWDAEATQRMTVTVRTNAALEVAQPLPPQTVLIGTTSEPLELTPYFHDPDDDPLTYTAVSDNAGVAIAEVAEGGSQLTIRRRGSGRSRRRRDGQRPFWRARQPVHDGEGEDERRARGGAAARGRAPCWQARRPSRWN